METRVQSAANPIGNAPPSAAAMIQQAKPTDAGREKSGQLDKLPVEVLINICEYLCWHCQSAKPTTQAWQEARHQIHCLVHSPTAALATLSRTCRRINGIATPFLYHGFSAAKAADLYKFLATIRHRPDLCRLVKAVFLEHVELDDNVLGLDNIQLVHDSLKSLGMRDTEINRTGPWWRQTKTRDNIATHALRSYPWAIEITVAQTIIAHLRNIETLHLEVPCENIAFFVPDTLAGFEGYFSGLERKPANVLWPHLRACTLLVGGTPEQTDFFEREVASSYPSTAITSCVGLLSLAPRATSLHLRSFIGISYEIPDMENITQLHLQCGNFRGPGLLDETLRCIRSLQVFSITWTFNSMTNWTTGFDSATLEEVVETLRTLHKDTLKRLQLGYPAAYYDASGLILPHLKDFAALEELKIQGKSIPGWQDDAEEAYLINLLPVSIRRLHIMYAGQLQMDHLTQLATDAQHPSTARKLHHLCEVTVMAYCPAEDSNNERYLDEIDSILDSPGWDGLQSAFEQTDIAFSSRTSSQIEWDICEF